MKKKPCSCKKGRKAKNVTALPMRQSQDGKEIPPLIKHL